MGQFVSIPTFLSTLSLRRATRFHAADISARRISIHALLAESDYHGRYSLRRSASFLSTLSLRRATFGKQKFNINSPFLSTLSLRRATRNSQNINRGHTISIHALLAESDRLNRSNPNRRKDFYPRSPCGERQFGRAFWPGLSY